MEDFFVGHRPGLWKQRVVSTWHSGAATAQTQVETTTAAMDKLLKFALAWNLCGGHRVELS